MKTEPTEAYFKEPENTFREWIKNVRTIKENLLFIADHGRINGSLLLDVLKLMQRSFEKGQSSPKIKQLEWVEVNDCGEIGIEAKTPFGDYGIYERSDHDGYTLWSCEPYPYVFDTDIQAKMYAQANFEQRVKEYLVLD